MPDFKNGKIYKLWSPEGDDIYIGSTTQTLSQRKGKHKISYNNNGCFSSKILFEKYNDVRIELIEDFPCDNKQQLNAREGHYIRTLNCVNKRIEGRTLKEYYQDHKEEMKEYREEHKEEKKEYMKQYREEHKEEIKEYKKEYDKQYYENNKEEKKEYAKQYRENNKDKIKEYKKQYRENNKDKIKEKKKQYYAKKKFPQSVA